MIIQKGKLSGVYEIAPEIHFDFRGHLSMTCTSELLEGKGLNVTWSEEYHSHTIKKYTVRGLYIQTPPFVETKLITAVRGKIVWMFVDLRTGSETFGQWGSYMLSEELNNSLYLPKGFAHGCVSLEDKSDLYIKADSLYSGSHGVGIKWNDPELNINWRLEGHAPIISDAHDSYPSFKAFKEQHGSIDI